MEDVLDVYERWLDAVNPVVCLDEKPCQLIRDVLHPVQLRAGQVKREDSEYERCGTANLSGWVEPLTGKCDVWVTDRRTSVDYAHALKRLAAAYPEAEKVVLVQDNLSTHSKAALYQAFSPEKARTLAQRFEFHFTPKHGSWLNMRAGVLMGFRSAQESGAGVVGTRPAGLEGACGRQSRFGQGGGALVDPATAERRVHPLAVHHPGCSPETQSPLPRTDRLTVYWYMDNRSGQSEFGRFCSLTLEGGGLGRG